ncbi:MAG: hypothetical protein Q9M50_08020 [Methylococcales bacterium]|nr:hypothetical protein [Methylococcales bacterium]
MSPTQTLKFSWWNSSLSPPIKRTENEYDKHRKVAVEVIYKLLNEKEIDFLALGEVSADDVTFFKQLKELENYEIVTGVVKSGRVNFDTCFIYHQDKVRIHSEVIVIDTARGDQKIKIAQKIILEIINEKEPFYLFVSHWKSRLHCSKSDADRHLLGMRLRDEVDDIYKNFGKDAPLILLGDYNDEPFDDPLSEQLMATRDKALILKKEFLLYNPFWQYLSYQNPDYAGTYYYKSGSITQWHTFDQIIVSSVFIIGNKWLLDEKETGIVYFSDYLKQVKNGKTIFDHLPVMTTLKKGV